MATEHDAYFEEVEARFERALDFDLGLEEEFQVLDSETLALTPGFEALRDSAPERLRGRIAGELLASKIEVSTPRTLHFGQAAKQLLLNRTELFAHAEARAMPSAPRARTRSRAGKTRRSSTRRTTGWSRTG